MFTYMENKKEPYNCRPFYKKWKKCIDAHYNSNCCGPSHCKSVFEDWVNCHEKHRNTKNVLEFTYSYKSIDGPYGGFS